MKITKSIITKRDEKYPDYGEAIVEMEDTDTGVIKTAAVSFDLTKKEGEAIAEAIEKASNKF